MSVTAKVKIYQISPGLPTPDAPAPEAQSVRFSADYVTPDGQAINQEWAYYTPSLDIGMTVRTEVLVANGWNVGDSFTLTFDKIPEE